MEDVRHYGFEVRRLDYVFARNLEAKVREKGIDELTLMHGWIIRYLIENQDKDIYQKDIEKHCSIGRSTVTNILQLMEKKGLIRREAVPNDARLKKVMLTQKGLESHEGIEQLIMELNHQMIQGISEEDLEIFLRTTRALRKNIEKNLKFKSGENREGGCPC